MEVRNPTPPSLRYIGFHPSYLCWVKPEQQRAIAYLSRLGGGTEPNTTIVG
ncbi:hypothetical protein AAEJ74_25025 [Limnospira fusiformis PMC 851.14]|uniref:Uncharacterized protein n=1 Tax=Limnospira fusiformis PMC 851.14 TaxID=2219512 RepID=A0ABU9EUN5_LIMFS